MSRQNTETADALLHDLFNFLTDLYGPLWTNRFKDEEGARRIKALWFDMLRGETHVSIEHGVRALARSGREYPPTPGAFAALCHATPEELGYPSEEAAYSLACGHAALRPWIVRKAMLSLRMDGIDAWELRTQPNGRARARFKHWYAQTFELARLGKLEPEPVTPARYRLRRALKLNPEQRRAGLRAIRKIRAGPLRELLQ